MTKLTATQKQKLDQATQEADDSEAKTIATSSQLLAAARAKQETDLADLQNSMDALADEFANRAAAIVRSGLQSSYIQARQRIGAIDLSFFDNGDELPQSNNFALLPAVEEVTA